MWRACETPSSLSHLISLDEATASVQVKLCYVSEEVTEQSFKTWDVDTQQQAAPEVTTDRKKNAVRDVLHELIATNPFEAVWTGPSLQQYIKNLRGTVARSEIEDFLALWASDLTLSSYDTRAWQAALSSSVEEPFRKFKVGYRNPTEALLSLGPDKAHMAEFNWLLVDTRLGELEYVVDFKIAGVERSLYQGFINATRETVWRTLQVFRLTTLAQQLNRGTCDRLARLYIEATVSDSSVSQKPPVGFANSMERVMTIPKVKRRKKDGTEEESEMGRAQALELEAYDWYANRALSLLLQKNADGTVMAPVFTTTGAATGRYAPLESMDKFVCRLAPTKWHVIPLTAVVQNFNRLVIQLRTRACDSRFPHVVEDRHLLAFDNGIYWTREDEFLSHSDLATGPFPHVSCLNYFNQVFPNEYFKSVLQKYSKRRYPGFFISTPPVQAILDHQRLPDEVCFFIYALFGRLWYKLKDLDSWDIWPYLQGKAGTGKSSLLNIICNTYPPDKIAVISNVVQEQFQTEALEGKLAYVAPDCSRKFNFDKGTWCSMVCGEEGSMAGKRKKAKNVTYEAPGAGAGNEWPPYLDQGGNITRRIAAIIFYWEVVSVNTMLNEELIRHHAAILKKTNVCYLQLVRDHKNQDIWSFLPAEFIKNMRIMERSTNSLADYLQSSRVVLKKGVCVSTRDLQADYQDFCKATTRQPQSLTPSNIAYILKSNGIILAKHRKSREQVFLGVTLSSPQTEYKDTHDYDALPTFKFSDIGDSPHNLKPDSVGRHQPWSSGLEKLVQSRKLAESDAGSTQAEAFKRGNTEAASRLRMPTPDEQAMYASLFDESKEAKEPERKEDACEEKDEHKAAHADQPTLTQLERDRLRHQNSQTFLANTRRRAQEPQQKTGNLSGWKPSSSSSSSSAASTARVALAANRRITRSTASDAAAARALQDDMSKPSSEYGF